MKKNTLKKTLPKLVFQGRPECELNKLHACILQHLPFEQAFDIISCLMQSFRSNIDDVSAFNSVYTVHEVDVFVFKSAHQIEMD